MTIDFDLRLRCLSCRANWRSTPEPSRAGALLAALRWSRRSHGCVMAPACSTTRNASIRRRALLSPESRLKTVALPRSQSAEESVVSLSDPTVERRESQGVFTGQDLAEKERYERLRWIAMVTLMMAGRCPHADMGSRLHRELERTWPYSWAKGVDLRVACLPAPPHQTTPKARRSGTAIRTTPRRCEGVCLNVNWGDNGGTQLFTDDPFDHRTVKQPPSRPLTCTGSTRSSTSAARSSGFA